VNDAQPATHECAKLQFTNRKLSKPKSALGLCIHSTQLLASAFKRVSKS